MKVYIATRVQESKDKVDLDELSTTIRAAGMTDFCFIRDIEHYKHVFDTPKDRWEKIYDELGACDALLIDVSEYASGEQVIECGMAYALRKPVIVIRREGSEDKPLFDGLSSTVIEYKNYKMLAHSLEKYDRNRNFNITDKTTLFALLLFLGIGLTWGIAQFFLPLGIVGAIVYWLVIRHVFISMRAFDRVIIFIPLVAAWLGGIVMLWHAYVVLAWAWTLMYWLAVLVVIRKMKLSL